LMWSNFLYAYLPLAYIFLEASMKAIGWFLLQLLVFFLFSFKRFFLVFCTSLLLGISFANMFC
jgi:hypothetical protein